jgi:adenosylcobyric acid synthase
MTSTPALMILGTASHVGKSLLTVGLGRIFSDEGLRVAPFKAQNMSLNSAATPDGREIGRAQALQAEACRVLPCAEMNPVLIKPSSDMTSQIVVLGRVWGQMTASDYHLQRVEDLLPVVIESYRTLAERHDLMLLEGAGSPAEINLRKHDIVNMRMAHAADAECVLVGDIDRGGVFAALLGTVELLEPEDRARIRGFVINKFRGDVDLLRPGIETIEKRLGIPCAGVVPVLRDLGLEEEDSVGLENRGGRWDDASLKIGVVAFPHIANFTDFDALAMEPSVSVCFLKEPRHCDVLILPGSKQTLDDLLWLRERGFERLIQEHDGPLIGICGGFQMLGLSIEDPSGVENLGIARQMAGLGVLAASTVMLGEKTVRQVSGGYEIHIGETVGEASDVTGRVWGTYVHGIFDDDTFRHDFIDAERRRCGLDPATVHVNVTAERGQRIDRWADHVRKSLDLELIRSWTARPPHAPAPPLQSLAKSESQASSCRVRTMPIRVERRLDGRDDCCASPHRN